MASLFCSSSFADAFESLYGETSTSRSSTGSTGRMYSYTSLCRNGKADRKFGLDECYSDLRVTLKIYDGKTCSKNPDTFWVGKEKELDVTISKNHPMANKIETLFLDAQKMLAKKGANLKESLPRFKRY